MSDRTLPERNLQGKGSSASGFRWSAANPLLDSEGRTIFVADAHHCGGRQFVVRAGEKLTAFIEMEAANSVSRLTSYADDHEPFVVEVRL